MNYEIVFECRSINNKNIRNKELKILRKFEDKLYFEFGEDESNIKKRFYRDAKTLNEDFEAVEKIKEKLEKEKNSEEINITSGHAAVVEPIEIETERKNIKTEIFNKNKNKSGNKKIF